MSTLKVSPVELTNTDHSVLKVALSLVAKTQIQTELLTEHDRSGNVLIVDIDKPEGKRFFTEFKPSKQTQLLLISSEMVEELHHQHFLHKPIRVQTVKDILIDIKEELDTPRNLKNSSQLLNKEPSQIAEFSPDKNLFFTLLEAQKNQKVMQIYCPPHSALFVNSIDNVVATSAKKETLWKITHLLNTSINSLQLSHADFGVLAKGQRIIPLKNILWTTALYLSQSQIAAPNVTMDTPIQLKVWPNFSRLDFEPEHMQLTTLMTTKALTLKQAAQQTNLPESFVIGFFNAIWVMDLVIINPKQATAAHSQAKTTVKSSLLQKIANRLKLKNA
ncbi:hypothetical protein [Candidatus Albibeggiatoa sp. nov. NOAA]|uniref:hypothetical protein n=1 Tax=Candidatus Albibeggiatoa sp. nov. NOAA TaxID=3162724 RepID=UPI0032F1875E|nr:hypothetical protein [Thiotrichaceae bacterium]